MTIIYDPGVIKKLKRVNVKIRKSFKERVLLFAKNPSNSQLNNHPLREKYRGFRSIDINADWRVIYHEVKIKKEVIAYFDKLGTHTELYG